MLALSAAVPRVLACYVSRGHHRAFRVIRELLVHIGEVDVRGLYREHAYSSMFAYCVRALHMSEAEAYLRIGAARLSRAFPRVMTLLQAGELHLSAVKLLAPVLNGAQRG